MELIALVAAVAVDEPLVFAVRLLDDADVEAALFADGHGVELDIGADVWVPVAGEDYLFGRPVDEVGALLAADGADVEMAGEGVGGLGVADPLFVGVVPDDAHLVVVAKGGIVADYVPADAVGRGGDAGHDAPAAAGGLHGGVVDGEEFPLWIAAVGVEDDGAVVEVADDDIGLLAVLEWLTVVAQGFAPVQGIVGLGVAENDFGALGGVGVAADQGLVPHFEETVVWVVEGGGGNAGEVVAFPGQVLELDQGRFCLLRRRDGSFGVDQFVEDVVVEE